MKQMRTLSLLVSLLLALHCTKKEVKPGRVAALDCANATLIGELMVNEPVNTVTLTLPYLGGNGGDYENQSIPSTGVTGLTAIILEGQFLNGNGNLVCQIIGKPLSTGVAKFHFIIGGATCEASVTISSPCGAYIAPGVWKAFMCHNLGSKNMSAPPLQPSWEINGGYWLWGIKSQGAPGPSGPSEQQANGDSEEPWGPAGEFESWLDGYKTNLDPCPAGYRLPTRQEWENVLQYNNITLIGYWENSHTNYTSGIRIGEKLFLPAAGYRSHGPYNGELNGRGSSGNYWSSTGTKEGTAWAVSFSGANEFWVEVEDHDMEWGYCIRCIAE